jgi:hypothetical protein
MPPACRSYPGLHVTYRLNTGGVLRRWQLTWNAASMVILLLMYHFPDV